jgi:hypothetical protein
VRIATVFDGPLLATDESKPSGVSTRYKVLWSISWIVHFVFVYAVPGAWLTYHHRRVVSLQGSVNPRTQLPDHLQEVDLYAASSKEAMRTRLIQPGLPSALMRPISILIICYGLFAKASQVWIDFNFVEWGGLLLIPWIVGILADRKRTVRSDWGHTLALSFFFNAIPVRNAVSRYHLQSSPTDRPAPILRNSKEQGHFC